MSEKITSSTTSWQHDQIWSKAFKYSNSSTPHPTDIDKDSNRQPIENQPQIGGSSTLRTDTTGGCDRNESSLDPVRDDAHENQGHSAILGEQSPNRGFEEATGTRSISGADYGPRGMSLRILYLLHFPAQIPPSQSLWALALRALQQVPSVIAAHSTLTTQALGGGAHKHVSSNSPSCCQKVIDHDSSALPKDDRAQYRVRRATMSTLPGHGYHCQLPRASAISKSPKPNEVKAWPATKEPSKDGESDGIGAGSSKTRGESRDG
ncbi:hypothetical protein H0H93_011914 [Arthromyces matolae]|nr:hypothetical protein H0H93_011914 [Arthromyces matolae]